MRHAFTPKILEVLSESHGDAGTDIYDKSPLIQYLNIKTKSASRGAKSRGSFGNIYAIYVLVEDYLKNGFDRSGEYEDYAGARFSDLFARQRELPFGSKLQNHALNHRLNQEFEKYFSQVEAVPIIRDTETSRYWINEGLLVVSVAGTRHNIAEAVVRIIDEYVQAKTGAFERFIENCEKLQKVAVAGGDEAIEFVLGLLAPNVDARLFEIASYAILKFFYHDQVVYFGFQRDQIEELRLTLYKTGRTNANDGGIDFVMRPLGRFFQVTETLDVRKYFLDIDKIHRYPISFVVKTDLSHQHILDRLREGARRQFPVAKIVSQYMEAIEEVINIPMLRERFTEAVEAGFLEDVLAEIVLQSKVEFNYED